MEKLEEQRGKKKKGNEEKHKRIITKFLSRSLSGIKSCLWENGDLESSRRVRL